MGFSASSLYLAGLVLAAPAYAQASQDKPPPAKPPRSDIVVTGQKPEQPPANPMPGDVAKTSRGIAAASHQFARCLNEVELDLQRTVVEGHPRDGATQKALDQLIRAHKGCYPRFRVAIDIGKNFFYGTCNPEVAGARDGSRPPNASGSLTEKPNLQIEMQVCRAPYDRGAIVEEAFRAYAPHFMLTRADTLNKEVIARFRTREEVRGKHRGPMDRRYYDTVSCMVQLEPESAIRLLRTMPGDSQETQLRNLIIAKTGLCTGNAKEVRVDPPQFRGYLGDALYHWTIAAKNIDTLIPST